MDNTTDDHRRRASDEINDAVPMYEGVLLLETGDALLLENDNRIELEGMIFVP